MTGTRSRPFPMPVRGDVHRSAVASPSQLWIAWRLARRKDLSTWQRARLYWSFWVRSQLSVVRMLPSRGQEAYARLITLAVFAAAFLWAFRSGAQEDESEDERIREEVQRLSRLRKEFEEGGEEENDDSIFESLRAAREKLAADEEDDSSA